MGNKVVGGDPEYSYDPFPETAGRLIGGPDWQPGQALRGFKLVYRRIRGWPHTPEYLRQMIAGDKPVSLLAMEVLAPALGKSPEYFFEYRIGQIAEQFRRHQDLEKYFYQEIMKWAARSEETGDPLRRSIESV